MLTPKFYYYRPWKSWVLTWHDSDDNQIGDCEYFYSKTEVMKEIQNASSKNQ